MAKSEIIQQIVQIIRGIDQTYCMEIHEFQDGDFGDLLEVDFSNGHRMGHVAAWANGFIFHNLIDSRLNNYEVIEETLIDARALTDDEVIAALAALFLEMRRV